MKKTSCTLFAVALSVALMAAASEAWKAVIHAGHQGLIMEKRNGIITAV